MLEENIVAMLKADTALAALVVNRIYPLTLPQESELPAIRYTMISSRPTTTHDGDSGLATALFQFDCFAATYTAAKALAAALRATLSGTSDLSRGIHAAILTATADRQNTDTGHRWVEMEIRVTYE